MSATQSTTLEGWGDADQYKAGNCIDGDTGGRKPDGQYSLCHTNDDVTPWIAVDYGTRVTVERVEIFNRLDAGRHTTQNVDVRISDELPTSAPHIGSRLMFSGGILLGHFAGPAKKGQQIIVSGQQLL